MSPITPIAFPPALTPAPTSRRSYQREPSPGDSRSPRRFSHSRGRPSGLRGESTTRSAASVSRDRSESDVGSRAPLWRKRDGVRDGGPDVPKGDPRARLHPLAAHFLGFRSSPPALGALPYLTARLEVLLLTFIGAFGSILLVCAVSVALSAQFDGIPLAIGSLGATAVLLYAVPEGPLSQPKCLVGGHVISAIVGVRELFELSPRFREGTIATGADFESLTAVACALAVAIAILLMQLTKTVHPPGGATALIAIFSRSAHWAYILLVLLSVVAMGLWACLIKNLGRRKYPAYWWDPPAPPAAPAAAVTQGSPERGTLAVLGEGEEDGDGDEEKDEARGRKSTRS